MPSKQVEINARIFADQLPWIARKIIDEGAFDHREWHLWHADSLAKLAAMIREGYAEERRQVKSQVELEAEVVRLRADGNILQSNCIELEIRLDTIRESSQCPPACSLEDWIKLLVGAWERECQAQRPSGGS